MKYHFTINQYKDFNTGLIVSNPMVSIDNQEQYGWFFLDEIQNLSLNIEYLKEVASKLESLLSGKTLFYEGFGCHAYMIECNQVQAKVKNIQDEESVVATIPTKELYHLIKDWYEFVMDFHNNKVNELSRLTATLDNSGSFSFNKFDIQSSIISETIHVGEINQKEFILNIDIGRQQTLSFDAAGPIHNRFWPKRFGSNQEKEEITQLIGAEISFTKKGTYYLKKRSPFHSFKSLYLSVGTVNRHTCLVSYYYEEKQPTLYLTYLDCVVQVKKSNSSKV